MREWISKDEYGNLRWRSRGRSYWPDLKNQEYKNEVLRTAEIAIDAGEDELYYDWAIGGTEGIMGFFLDVQNLIARKGKNLTVFGNCKGNILADGVCDIGKSEGTEEAGIWDGRWVHNVVQARFYYAAGDGWKPYWERAVDKLAADALVPLNMDTYIPNGVTPMYDCIGMALQDLEQHDEEGDLGFLFVVISDGLENSSKEWTADRIAEKVKNLELMR